MDLLQGTLDMLVLRTLLLSGPLHGYGVAKSIRTASNEALEIEFGSLYPALRRLEAKGWIASSWETPITIGAPGSTSSPRPAASAW